MNDLTQWSFAPIQKTTSTLLFWVLESSLNMVSNHIAASACFNWQWKSPHSSSCFGCIKFPLMSLLPALWPAEFGGFQIPHWSQSQFCCHCCEKDMGWMSSKKWKNIQEQWSAGCWWHEHEWNSIKKKNNWGKGDRAGWRTIFIKCKKCN